MKRILVGVCVCWLTLAVPASGGHLNNVAPLAFGMTQDVATVLRAPLNYIAGRPGSEVFLADVDTSIPGFYPVGAHIYLQFRHGHLTGWKTDRRLRPRFLFF